VQVKKNNQAIALSSAIATLLISGLFSTQAYANQLDALLLPDKDSSNAEFAGVRFITLQYTQGSALAKILNGTNERIEFSLNGTFNGTQGNGMDKVIQAINNAMLEKRSPVTIENASLRYFATVKGYPDMAQLSYNIEFKPTLTKYVLQKAGENNEPAIVDLEWRDITIKGPLMVKAEQYGTVNINQPVGLLQLLYPELTQKLLGSEAKEIIEDSIMNFDRFGLSMKSWHYLFDVTGKQLERYGVFREGEGGTVSIHSIGESSFREGTYLPVERDATAKIDEAELKIHASTPPPSGQITITGYSSVQEKNIAEYSLVYPNSPGGIGLEIFGFQFMVLLVFGGMMATIAVFVLFKAKK
jgi:hypothetical protein